MTEDEINPVLILVCVEVSVGVEILNYEYTEKDFVLILVCVEVSVGDLVEEFLNK